jgi:hypothetical protein
MIFSIFVWNDFWIKIIEFCKKLQSIFRENFHSKFLCSLLHQKS